MSAEQLPSHDQPKPETFALDFRTPTENGILPKFVEQLLFKDAKDIARALGEPRPHQGEFRVKTSDAVSDEPDAYIRSVTIITSLSERMRAALLEHMVASGYRPTDGATVLTIVTGDSDENEGEMKEAV